MRGELKILGYSAYLHPVGDHELLGIGQDATAEGVRQGTQLSLFDVADPANPKLLHKVALGELTSSEAEYDHHAFLWWEPLRLAVVPVSDYEGGEPAQAIGFHVDRTTGIAEIGPHARDRRRAAHAGDRPASVHADRRGPARVRPQHARARAVHVLLAASSGARAALQPA